MKHVLLFLLISISADSLLAQAQKQDAAQNKANPNPLVQHFIRKYATAVQWNDDQVAKDALYDLIVENPLNDSLIFNLAYFYYESQKYASSLLVSQELVKRKPKNLAYLELAAASGEAVGVTDKALQNYESIYLLSSNLAVLYKVAFLQFELKRFTECLANTEILLSKPEVDSLKVAFNDAENKPKEYSMRTSVLNLKGLLSQEQGDKVAAKKYFDEALAISPDFVPAKQNLAKLK